MSFSCLPSSPLPVIFDITLTLSYITKDIDMRTSNESLTAQENGNSGNFGGFDHYLCPADTPYPYNPKQYIADMAESEMNNRDGP